MLKIVILEDQPDQARQLAQMLERYRLGHEGFAYELQLYERSMQLLSDYRCDADLMLLDIQMPDMLGIDAAKRIRAMDSRVMIIFVTTLTQYAIEGYSVGAFDYMVKPVHYDAFAAKLDRARRMLAHQHSSVSLELRNRGELRRVSADEIYYLEVVNHDVLIHTDSETYRQWGSLKPFEEQLKGANFVRCNACYLVNLKYVRGISGDSVLVDGEKLIVSKPKRKDFLAALAQYRGGSR